MAIGDITSTARGTGARYNDGKTRFDLIPLASLRPAADVFEYGAKKYSERNWMRGQPWSVPMASMMRHLADLQAGEMIDNESNLPHVGHILCNAIMLAHFYQFYAEGDDISCLKRFFENEPVSGAPQR